MAIRNTFDMIGSLFTLIKTLKTLPKPEHDGSIGLHLREVAARHPDKVFCIFESQTLTYGELDKQSNQVARMLKAEGVVKGDTLALMMENRIESIILAMGIVKLGAICSLINTSLTGKGLIHCVEAVQSKKFIFGEELMDAVAGVKDQLKLGPGDYIYVADDYEGRGGGSCPDWARDFSERLQAHGTEDLPETDQLILDDPAFYIFTSGTTGLPKATIMKHYRWILTGIANQKLSFLLNADDRIYVALPLYHGSGQIIGVGGAIFCGASIFLRRQFSASNFLTEAREHKTTAFLYIGEICRYIHETPRRDDDHLNPITKISGNGLRSDIWMDFKNRFGIERIFEFYSASEAVGSTGNMFNKDKTIGLSLGRLALIEYDAMNDEIIRNADGRCVKVKKGEPGLVIFPINDRNRFEGYADDKATEKKVLRNVFKDGDIYFNSGDILRRVDVGFALGLPHFEFVDRVGDTFRWKGENVSTMEVGAMLQDHECVSLANVYGVTIPGTNGRAGMAAISLAEGVSFDPESFSGFVHENLPPYARPIFIRILTEMDTTGTHKLKKGRLKEEAFHPEKTGADKVYVLKPGEETYGELNREFYSEMMEEKARY